MSDISTKITISIVSHGHGDMIVRLLNQLCSFSFYISRVILTINTSEKININVEEYNFELIQIFNIQKRGFGENHNSAFKFCNSDYYCVMNPDIEIIDNPFDELLKCSNKSNHDLLAPMILNSVGNIEDSARFFPTPFLLLKKIFFGEKGSYSIEAFESNIYPDWVAGMFLLIPSEIFSNVKGFDKDYFLYYEDVDLCLRLWKSGYRVKLCIKSVVIHRAQRDSHKKLNYFIWHVKSLLLFWYKHLGRFPKKEV